MRHQYVFVCGLHRSGTSVLARSLCLHPQVSGFHNTGAVEDEGQFLQSVYLPAFHYGGAGVFGLDARSYLDETSPLVNPEDVARLRAEWSRHWDLGCPILLEKSPPNLVRTRFLRAAFPGAQFVVILRHPIAVSLATKKRGGIPLCALIEHWVVCHERFLADYGRLDRVHVLWYEDLVARPEAVLGEVWRALGLESVPLGEAFRSHNETYVARWNALGRSAWGRAYRGWICRRFETRIAAFGYSLADPSFLDLGPLAAPTHDASRPSAFSRAWASGVAAWERTRRGLPAFGRGHTESQET